MEEKLAEGYGQLFSLFYQHRDKITRVTFWGMTDANSWLNNWPIKGRTNYPLPFDREGNEKKPVMKAIRNWSGV
ncbi:MAG: endo-1,4-beta-xylanase [Cyclobacteriaceae bacterium]